MDDWQTKNRSAGCISQDVIIRPQGHKIRAIYHLPGEKNTFVAWLTGGPGDTLPLP